MMISNYLRTKLFLMVISLVHLVIFKNVFSIMKRRWAVLNRDQILDVVYIFSPSLLWLVNLLGLLQLMLGRIGIHYVQIFWVNNYSM
jgi:hypothetical protein